MDREIQQGLSIIRENIRKRDKAYRLRADWEAKISTHLIESGSDGLPPQLESLAETLGVSEIRIGPVPVSGRTIASSTGLILEVDERLDEPSRRFVIAHEFAHLVVEGTDIAQGCHRNNRAHRGPHTGWQDIEKVCDQLAGVILLPAHELRRIILDRMPSAKIVLQLARKAVMPLEVTVQRILEEHIWKCEFIWWRLQNGKACATLAFPSRGEDELAWLEIVGETNPLAQCVVEEREVSAEAYLKMLDSENAVRISALPVDGNTVFSAVEPRVPMRRPSRVRPS